MASYSRKRLDAMLLAIDQSETADAKGDALEILSTYLFEKLRGVSLLRRNILDAPRAHELDIAFWNDQPRSELAFLDAVLVVECKASDRPVGSEEVGWFVRKLQDRGAHHGILIALNGITGSSSEVTSAHSEVLGALLRDKIKVLLVTRAEIITLSCSADLADLLKQKLLILTLERAVHHE
jgi:hypothetical protein